MDEVGDREPLSRFIFSQSHFSSVQGRVKHNAFMPTFEGKTSVFRIESVSAFEVWQTGEEVSTERRQTLYGRGDVIAGTARGIGLDVKPEEPPPRHANIVEWPVDKGEQKVKAILLAAEASLVLRQ